MSTARQVTALRVGIAWNRSRTWHFQDVAGVGRTPTRYAERRTRSVPFLRWDDRTWGHRRLHAKRYAARHRHRIAHLAFWLCVHGGEGNSSPSAGHPWSGVLQMTSYWAGYRVYDWSQLSAREVYADAEAQLQIHARRGDLSAWIRQQWPHTSPPCLGYL